MKKQRSIIGWREWISLPQLSIPRIKAKIDTGARTSALHTFWVEIFQDQGKDKVRFAIHPFQRSPKKAIVYTADLVDFRWVMDSGGHREQRYVIATEILLGDKCQTVEITLTSRDDMRFRMLLGRTALHNHFLVNPSASYLLGKKKKEV